MPYRYNIYLRAHTHAMALITSRDERLTLSAYISKLIMQDCLERAQSLGLSVDDYARLCYDKVKVDERRLNVD